MAVKTEEKLQSLLTLQDSDFTMLIEALENYKSKDFSSRMLMDMTEAVLFKKPTEDSTPAEWASYNKRQEEKRAEEAKRKVAEESFKKEVDILKSKLILLTMIKESDSRKLLPEDK